MWKMRRREKDRLVSVCTYEGCCQFKAWRKPTSKYRFYLPICLWNGTCNHKVEMSSRDLAKSELFYSLRRERPFDKKGFLSCILSWFKGKKRKEKNV